jgi:pimeloyl-ACP methyl ester carboxylesterase
MMDLLEVALGALNGAVGDYLARTNNGLATTMACIHEGVPLAVERAALARALPEATPRVVVLVHGLMCTEAIWRPADGSADYGAALARDLGYTPLYLRYNTGLPIARSGEALAELLEKLLAEYPVPLQELLLLGYSMGGLVIRSACRVASLAGHPWLPRVRRAIYVGTPHLGSPIERAGRFLTGVLAAIPDPYTRLIADIGNLRSQGIKDLGDGLTRADHPVPLLPGIRHFLAAGTLSEDPRLATLFGDALVSVRSSTNGVIARANWSALPPDHVKLFPRVGHIALARHPEVYTQIRAWCEEEAAT